MTRKRKIAIASVPALIVIGAAAYQFRWIFPLLFLIALGLGKYEVEEVDRISSPDGRVDALLIRGDGGATTSVFYDVYLVPKGGSTPNRDETVFRADHAGNSAVNIRWIANGQLRIEYERANIYRFTNFWYDPSTLGGSPRGKTLYEVRITEGQSLAPVTP